MTDIKNLFDGISTDLKCEDYSLPITTVLTYFQMTKQELRQELAAGRLSATGTPTAHGFSNIKIKASVLLKWAYQTKQGRDFVIKAVTKQKE